MTTKEQNKPTSVLSDVSYPTLLRRGHKFLRSLGQRLSLGGFYGPIDIALGSDEWIYVLNRSETLNTTRIRYVPMTAEDKNGTMLHPKVGGKVERHGQERFPSAVMCTIDSDGILYSTDEHANSILMLSTSGETIGWWGEYGSEPGQLHGPSGITLDADENLWIVNSQNHRVQKFTRKGEYLSGWGNFGTDPDQLNFPWGIAIDPVNHSILIADWRNNLVKRFNTDGELLQVIGKSGRGVGEMTRPSSVAVDQHGDIYIVDRGNNRILIYNHRGMFMESLIGDGTMTDKGVRKLLTNPDALRLRDNVVNFDQEKRFANPTSVKVDSEGRVFVVDTGRWRMQVYQKLFRVLEPHEIDAPELHADPEVY